MKYKIILIGLLALLTSPFFLKAQVTTQEATVKVNGEVIIPLNLKIADLNQFPQVEVKRKDKDGNDHTYTGVLLSDILQKAGATLGKDLHGKNLNKFVQVEASDGYQVVFAIAELDKGFTDRLIILATQMDGKPLSTTEGPFHIVIQDEKKPARCVRMVTAINVQFAK
ncbi:MAG: molybdopterin-dependent oxidoreductase [Bacteroidota bacterium]|nr:molybdopterin-dependent oxidoreductase [Bacteroidota bacterium]